MGIHVTSRAFAEQRMSASFRSARRSMMRVNSFSLRSRSLCLFLGAAPIVKWRFITERSSEYFRCAPIFRKISFQILRTVSARPNSRRHPSVFLVTSSNGEIGTWFKILCLLGLLKKRSCLNRTNYTVSVIKDK